MELQENARNVCIILRDTTVKLVSSEHMAIHWHQAKSKAGRDAKTADAIQTELKLEKIIATRTMDNANAKTELAVNTAKSVLKDITDMARKKAASSAAVTR